MYVLLFLFWLLLNGKITTEIVLFGVGIDLAVSLFALKFMDYTPKKELCLWRSIGVIAVFLLTLLKEIVLANLNVIRLVLSPKYTPEPAMVYFRTTLRTGFAKVLLANAITLTPGTITVSLVGDEYCVHCLDRSYAEGIEASAFTTLLAKMEAYWK